MKRIISIITAILLVCTMTISAFGKESAIDADISEAIARVSGLGIIQGDDSGFRLEDNITRAEFMTIICRLLGYDKAQESNTGFSDVPSAHWASGYIAVAKALGIAEGIGNNMFAPDANITYNEAIKMLVVLLGYGAQAQEKGGYPNGYLVQAAVLGLIDDEDINDEFAQRGVIAVIVNNALDVNPLEPDYGIDNKYIVSDKTLYEKLSNIEDTIEFKGIFEENAQSSIRNEIPVCQEDMVIIDGREYHSPQLYGNLLGRHVHGFAREYKGGRLEIVSIYATDYENNISSANSENLDINPATNLAVIYEDGGREKKTELLPTAVYMYNGRKIAKNDALVNGATDADYTFIDNTGDRVADIVMIEESKSFMVDRVNEKSSYVYFENGKSFRGGRGIGLVADDSLGDSYVFLMDAEGTALSPSEVKEGSVLTVTASKDLRLCTILVSDKTVEGEITSVDEDNAEINGEEYKYLYIPDVGEDGVFALDAKNVIVGKLEGKTDFEYGYVIAADREGGLSDKLKLKIITASSPEKEIKTKDNTDTIYYHMQNSEPVIFDCADKVSFAKDKFDDSGDRVSASLLVPSELEGSICVYRLNAKGEISYLNIYTLPGELVNTKLNAEIFAFGGSTASRGFATNDDTKVVCVPNFVRRDEDYSVRVSIADKGSYKVYGVKATSKFNPNGSEEERARFRSEEVDVLVIKANMDSSVPLPIQEDANICILGSVSSVYNSDGDVAMKLEFIDGDKILTKYTEDSGEAFNIAKSLRLGDLIRYSENSDGTIANIEHLASVQGLQSYRAEANAKNGYKSHYGICDDIIYSSYDYMVNDYVDSLTISFNGASENKSLKLLEEDIQVYLYNRRAGTIEIAGTDDIITLQQAGDPTKVFALIKDNDPKAIVIIKD